MRNTLIWGFWPFSLSPTNSVYFSCILSPLLSQNHDEHNDDSNDGDDNDNDDDPDDLDDDDEKDG